MILEPITSTDLTKEIQELFIRGLPKGASTGWPTIDSFYTVVPGQFTVVTGVPGHGKSEWLDALSVNLALEGWKFVVFSPENQPHELHVSKLLEKFVKRPFRAGFSDRMTSEELAIAMSCIEMSYRFLRINKEFMLMPTLASVLHSASVVFQQWINDGEEKLGLIIDPWNEMEHGRTGGQSETEYISSSLSSARQFAREWGVHLWLVAHPTKLQKDKEGKYPVPTLYDISGSAHWRNKADNGIVIHRNVMDHSAKVEVHVQKIRFKNVGRPGIVSLDYDYETGCYNDSTTHEYMRDAAKDEISF